MDIRKSIDALAASTLSSERILFKKIGSESDLRSMGCLYLGEDQADMVNPLWFSLGRAYVNPCENIPLLIVKKEDNTLIGFIQLCRFLGDSEDSVSWSYFIIPEYQHMGFGTEAASLAINILSKAFPSYKIKLSVEKENKRAQELYRRLGFSYSGEQDGDDMVFVY